METITVNIDTIRDALRSPSLGKVLDSIRIKMEEGSIVKVVQEYSNAPTDELFDINTFDEFELWIEGGCKTSL